MMQRVAICLALVTICGPTAWPVELELLTEETLAARASRSWKYDELQPHVDRTLNGRSFEKGRQLYRIVKCYTCHRMNGEGNEFGPDLTKLDQDLELTKLLEDVIEPSKVIHRDFQSHRFVLESGKIVEGLIVAAGVNDVRVVENPLSSTQPTRVRLDQIDRRTRSAVSLMPKGLLDRYTEGEVLDILAYVYSRGSDQAPPFKR